MASAPVALGIGGVSAVLLISGIQGKSIGSIIQGDFGTPPDPKGPESVESLATESSATGGTGTGATKGAPNGKFPAQVQRAVAWCDGVSGKYPYAWGGGHGSIGQPSKGGENGPTGKPVIGFDCSGAVSGALHAANLLRAPMTSGELAALWGAPGHGKYITVYANPIHTFMNIGGSWFGTGHIGKGGGGPAWGNHDTPTGYAVKHFPGL